MTDNLIILVVNVLAIIGAAIKILSYVKAEIIAQRKQDESQNTDIALLKSRLDYLEANTKELKEEIVEKVDKVTVKVDDLKHMLIEFFAKQR